jgi:hypothetical protein
MSVLDVSPLLDCPGSGFHLAGRPGGIIGAGIAATAEAAAFARRDLVGA